MGLPRKEFIMKKNNKNFLIGIILLLLAILFTVLVKIVDVKPIGANNTYIGFSTINQFVFKNIGVNIIWYHITEYLGIIAIFMAAIYALLGFIQLIKRKSLFKIDKELILLGIFYIIIILIYIFFEKVIINYRPILIDNILEASYPSSHTLMTICLCGSAIIINKKLYHNKVTKILNILLFIIMLLTVIGRLISGVHWFTDIIGGILISISLLKILHSLMHTIE